MQKNHSCSVTDGAAALAALFDNGNYSELGAHVLRSSGEKEGVVCGYGPVDGRLCFAFAQDAAQMNGAFDSRAGGKIRNLYELAMKSGAPVIGVFGCGGSVVTEGASLLSGLGSLFSSAVSAGEKIPQIALILGDCTGSMAITASLFDVCIAVKGTEFSAGAESVLGSPSDPTACGLSALTAENAADGFRMARSLLGALPDCVGAGPALTDETDLNRALTLTKEEAKNTKTLLSALSDNGSFIELFAGYGHDITAGFAPMAGRSVGLVALCGLLSPDGADKAARFVKLCGRFGIPLITLIDSEGFEVSLHAEQKGMVLAMASLAKAYRLCAAPRISVVTGSACGAVLPLMGSRAGAADVSFALEDTVISPLPPARAVAFLMNDQVSDRMPRNVLESSFAEKEASAQKAAFLGDIDFTVTLPELRARLCGALLMLSGN